MKKENSEKNTKSDKRAHKFSVIGGMWAAKKNGSGAPFFKIQIMVNDRQINLTAWKNQRKNHPQGPDFLVYAPVLGESD